MNSARVGRGVFGEARDHAVALAQIDRQHALSRMRASRCRLTRLGHRRRGISLGQQNVDAVGHLQIPATPRNEHPGADPFAQIARRIEQRQIFAEPHIGAVANDERQVREAPVAHGVERRTVGGDDMHRAVRLPQGGGLALLDLDQQAVGIEFSDRDLFDERKLLQPLAHARDIEEGQRIARSNSRLSTRISASLNSLSPATVTALMLKPKGARENVRRRALLGDEGRIMAALHRAVNARRQKKPGDETEGRPGPAQPCENATIVAAPRSPRARTRSGGERAPARAGSGRRPQTRGKSRAIGADAPCVNLNDRRRRLRPSIEQAHQKTRRHRRQSRARGRSRSFRAGC